MKTAAFVSLSILLAGCECRVAHRDGTPRLGSSVTSGTHRGVRNLGPLAGSVVTSNTIRFRWSPEAAGELQLSRARDFREPQLHSGEGGEVVVSDMANGRWFWRVRSADGDLSPKWSLRIVGRTNAVVSQGVMLGADCNGDGVDDVTGEKALFLGGDKPGASNLELTWYGTDVGLCSHAGVAMPYSLGDMNGDGCSELLLCASRVKPCVLFDSCAPSEPPAPWVGSWRDVPPNLSRATRLGDVNGDGRGDVAIRYGVDALRPKWRMILGGTKDWVTGGGAELVGNYEVVFGGGDIDGDGLHDFVGVVKGAPDLNVHFGTRDTTALDATVSVALPRVASKQLRVALGDVDGDGHADIVAFGRDEQNRPRVWVVNGGLGRRKLGVTAQYVWDEPRIVADPGLTIDHNGQSSDHATIVVAPGSSSRADLVLLAQGADRRLRRLRIPQQPYAGEPVSIRAVGDVTGDGIDDLIHPTTLDLHHLNVYPGLGAPTRLLEQPYSRLASNWQCGKPAERNVRIFDSP